MCIRDRFGCASEFTLENSLAGLKKFIKSRPIFKTSHVPYGYIVKKGNPLPFESISRNSFLNDFDFLRDCKVLAFAGIARNDDFLHTVESFNCDISNFIEFEDHHEYSDNDLKRIISQAEKASVEFLMTTEKDYAKIANRITWPTDLVVIGIEISFINDSKAFADFIKATLSVA